MATAMVRSPVVSKDGISSITIQQSLHQQAPCPCDSRSVSTDTGSSVLSQQRDANHGSGVGTASAAAVYRDDFSIKEQITQARIVLYRKNLISERSSGAVREARRDDQSNALQLAPIAYMNGIDLTMTKQEHAMLAALSDTSDFKAVIPHPDEYKDFQTPHHCSDSKTFRDPGYGQPREDWADLPLQWQDGGILVPEDLESLAKPQMQRGTRPNLRPTRSLLIEDIFDLVAASRSGKECATLSLT